MEAYKRLVGNSLAIGHKKAWGLLMVLAIVGVFAGAKVFGQKTIWKVEYSGAMREMFATGDIAGKTEMSKLKPQQHLYGVGPLEDLSGEIMVWDGNPLISFVKDKGVKVATDPNAKAVFLFDAGCQMAEMPVPADIKTYDQFEKFVADSAESIGLSSAEPFPFLLKGDFRSVEIHINDYRPDGAKLTREKHDAPEI
ncbi:MAG: hypothetical protein IPG58_17730 [Acidobacteria bacterium]|nr:hypothetical protein [Acidobacteriota bacterium]